MGQLLSFFQDTGPLFYLKILGIIVVVILLVIGISKLFSIISDKNKDLKFEKKQEKIKRNKRNTAELNKRFGISGRISSAAFKESVDIEDIKENNNVDLGHRRMSSKDLKRGE